MGFGGDGDENMSPNSQGIDPRACHARRRVWFLAISRGGQTEYSKVEVVDTLSGFYQLRLCTYMEKKYHPIHDELIASLTKRYVSMPRVAMF